MKYSQTHSLNGSNIRLYSFLVQITYDEWRGLCGLCEHWMNEADGRWALFGDTAATVLFEFVFSVS